MLARWRSAKAPDRSTEDASKPDASIQSTACVTTRVGVRNAPASAIALAVGPSSR
jgi:hypothetical protein